MDPRARDLLALMADDPWRMDCIGAVAGLGLPDCWIGSGFVRARLWDRLHGLTVPTPLNDIDVIYFDAADVEPQRDYDLEAQLATVMPDAPWSVRNQARMHERNNDRPYRSTRDSLTCWLETIAAVAVRLGEAGDLELLAPFGLDDLYDLVVRPTPHARQHRLAAYRARCAEKDWTARWPKVRVLDA